MNRFFHLQILRDFVDVPDTLGDGILSSYPLKVTHLKKTLTTFLRKTDDEKWTKDRIAENVIEMAREVGGDGERQLLKGIFLRNDNIMGESDRSYLEGKRILKKLKGISKSYSEHGKINTSIWIGLMILAFFTLAVELSAVVDTEWTALENKCLSHARSPPFPLETYFVIFFSVGVWISFLISVVGMFYVYILTLRWERDIFMVRPNLKIIYATLTITSTALVIFDLFVVIDYLLDDACTHLGHRIIIDSVAGVIFCLAALPIVLVFVSLIANMIFYKGCKGWSIYDVMMFEFPHCRSHLVPKPETEPPLDELGDFSKRNKEEDLSSLDTLSPMPTRPLLEPGGNPTV
jgi:hypothetical protein